MAPVDASSARPPSWWTVEHRRPRHSHHLWWRLGGIFGSHRFQRGATASWLVCAPLLRRRRSVLATDRGPHLDVVRVCSCRAVVGCQPLGDGLPMRLLDCFRLGGGLIESLDRIVHAGCRSTSSAGFGCFGGSGALVASGGCASVLPLVCVGKVVAHLGGSPFGVRCLGGGASGLQLAL